MVDIYMLSDAMIMARVGDRLRSSRLKQNITQQDLAKDAGVSLSSLKNLEKGEIRSFDTFLRVIRTLGSLELLQPLVEEEQLSPSEYYDMVHSAKARQRKRASGGKNLNKAKEDLEW